MRKDDFEVRQLQLRDEVGHQCPVRPSQLVYPSAVLGREGTRNPSPLSALSRMRKRCARCDGDAVALVERAPLDSRPRVEGEGYLPGGGSV